MVTYAQFMKDKVAETNRSYSALRADPKIKEEYNTLKKKKKTLGRKAPKKPRGKCKHPIDYTEFPKKRRDADTGTMKPNLHAGCGPHKVKYKGCCVKNFTKKELGEYS